MHVKAEKLHFILELLQLLPFYCFSEMQFRKSYRVNNTSRAVHVTFQKRAVEGLSLSADTQGHIVATLKIQ